MYNTKATILRMPGIVRMYDASKRMFVVTVVAVVVVVEYVPGKPVSAIFCKISPKAIQSVTVLKHSQYLSKHKL